MVSPTNDSPRPAWRPERTVSCGTCRFFESFPDIPQLQQEGVGACHRRAPAALVPDARDDDWTVPYAAWPRVLDDDWCGEYVWKQEGAK